MKNEVLFSKWLESLAESHGDSQALACEDTALSYRGLYQASVRCAAKLMEAGLKKDDKVVLWAINSVNWFVAFLGIVMAGGIAVLMNYNISTEDVAFLSKMTSARWAVVGKNKVLSQGSEAAVKALVSGGIPDKQILFMNDVFAASMDPFNEPDPKLFPERYSDPRDTRLIIFTTGTTSEPKAVQLSSFSMLSNTYATKHLMGDDLKDSACIALPLFHSFGLAMVLLTLSKGSHVWLMSYLKPVQILETVHQNRISWMASVGAIYNELTELPDFDEKAGDLLKICFVGGGLITPTEAMRIESRLHGGKLLIGYGQTECSPGISMNISRDPLKKRAVSVGHIMPGLDVRIWIEEVGFLNNGKIGEVVVKGPSLMNGYLGLPPEQQPIDREGWLHTGDLGIISDDGLLMLAGRIKDIIIRSGENISPSEIEKTIMNHPAIQQVKVFGAPHPVWGESVEACIVPSAEYLGEEKLRADLHKCLSSLKIPSHFFVYSSFPLSANGKLDQRSLRASMLEQLKGIYIRNALDQGLCVLHVSVGNRMYTIKPVCNMIQEMAEELGFPKNKRERIHMAVEGMLIERITNAYDTRGEISVEVVLLPQRLRIRITDSGNAYKLDQEGGSQSAKTILANVDAYSTFITDQKLNGQNLDWMYEDGFSVRKYLLSHGEEGKA